jgi:hypothetical protein
MAKITAHVGSHMIASLALLIHSLAVMKAANQTVGS